MERDLFKLRNKLVAGFTLIELLVVVSIIGILAALLMVNFVNVRQRGRDAQRKSNLRQIQSALELYRSDQTAYPATGGIPVCGEKFTENGSIGNTTYMQSVPCDPLSGTQYYYNSNTSTYTLVSCLENTNDPEGTATDPTSGSLTCSPAYYFTVTNP